MHNNPCTGDFRHRAWILRLILLFYKSFGTVSLAENGLLDLACGVPRNVCQYDLLRSLVTGKLVAELFELFNRTIAAGFDLDDRAGDLTESLVGESDDGNVLDLGIFLEEVLDLDGIDILAAGYDNVLLTVYEEVEAVLVLSCHITGIEPAIMQCSGSSLGIVIVLKHYAGALNTELADLALRNSVALFIDDLALPSVTGNADSADLVRVLESQVNASWAGRLGKTVVRIVLMFREIIPPVTDK